MTISQSSPSCVSGPAAFRPGSAMSFGRFIFLAVARWREHRRVTADLARLAEVGDHLLKDIGLDPKLARADGPAAIEAAMLERDNPIA